MGTPERFTAFRIHSDDAQFRAGLEQLSIDDLSAGDVVIKAAYSGVNYKDALAGTGKGKILRRSPLNGGIDVSGRVVQSASDDFAIGDSVLVTGAGMGEIYDGGYAEYVRIPSACAVMLPAQLNLKQAMLMGTPAFTAALALHRMQQNNQRPEHGPIIITGASGGVGNMAIDIFAKQGYEVIAVTSKKESSADLLALGATDVKLRQQLHMENTPLAKARWGGAVDTIGGDTLAWLTRTVKPWGNIASIGLAASAELHTTVMPFILRGVSLLGISSTNCPTPLRREIWQALGHELKPQHLEQMQQQTIDLSQLHSVFAQMLKGELRGRSVVRISPQG